MTYWSLTAWLTAMLADPELGPSMVDAMAKARQAATEPVSGVEDWYDGSNFRTAVANGLFNLNTSIALSISTDGFEAWRQLGFQGWPVVAIILNLDPSTRTRIVSQVLLTITPGPRQPVDLDSFLRPIADELNVLAAGINGVSVWGSDTSHTLSAFVVQVTADMPGGDKVTNATGYNGRCPNRFRSFHGVHHGSHYYFPPTHPSTGEVLFSLSSPCSSRRQLGAFRLHAAAVEQAQMDNRSAHYIAELGK